MTPNNPHIFEPPVHRWECAHCNARDVTREVEPHTRFHTCPGLGNISAPMIEESKRGTVHVRKVMREDYEGADAGRTQKDDDGAPVMAIETVHDDGHTDLAVLATVVGATGEVAR